MLKTIAITILLGMFLVPGSVQGLSPLPYALPDPGTLPGSPWYAFKRMSEGIGTFFTFGDAAKAERFLELSERRLAEAERLAAKGEQELAEEAVGRYQRQLENALARAESAKERGLDVDEVLEKVSEATLKHQEVLAGVYEQVPEQAKPAIERAMNAGMRGHEEALDAINGERGETLRQQFKEREQEARRRIEDLREEGIPIPEDDVSLPDIPTVDIAPDDPKGGPIPGHPVPGPLAPDSPTEPAPDTIPVPDVD